MNASAAWVGGCGPSLGARRSRSCCRSRWSPTCGSAGAIGDLMLVVVVAAGITGGADRGATYGFAAGLLYDLVVDTPVRPVRAHLRAGRLRRGPGRLGAACAPAAGGRWAWPRPPGAAQAVLYTALGNLVGVAYPFGDLPAIALVLAAGAALLVAARRAGHVVGARPPRARPAGGVLR